MRFTYGITAIAINIGSMVVKATSGSKTVPVINSNITDDSISPANPRLSRSPVRREAIEKNTKNPKKLVERITVDTASSIAVPPSTINSVDFTAAPLCNEAVTPKAEDSKNSNFYSTYMKEEEGVWYLHHDMDSGCLPHFNQLESSKDGIDSPKNKK